MATSPIYLTEADVGRLVTVKDAIATLEALFATWGQPSTSNLPRQRARLAGGGVNLTGGGPCAYGGHRAPDDAGGEGARTLPPPPSSFVDKHTDGVEPGL